MIQVLVIELRNAEPDEGSGVVVHIRSDDGCGADIIFHEPDIVLAIGDRLEVTGTTERGEVFVDKVKRIIKPGTL